MKSYRIHKKKAELKKSKKKNALVTISKSVKINYKPLNLLVIKTLRNTVQLIRNVGEDPKSPKFENGMLI
ncbi:hypothetical protein SAMN05660903_03660 [Salegentibacter salinarum]|nr:hypothetical protein SAMN05660903_03660 [Salegentibacter salinarum]